jgi:hypothetical protein
MFARCVAVTVLLACSPAFATARTIKVPCGIRDFDHAYMTDHNDFPTWWKDDWGYTVISTKPDGHGGLLCTLRPKTRAEWADFYATHR